jgi:hypothetical protein
MNNRDWITLKILVNQYDGPISVDGRIVGVKEIKEYTEIYKSGIIRVIIGIIIGSIVGAMTTILYETLHNIL